MCKGAYRCKDEEGLGGIEPPETSQECVVGLTDVVRVERLAMMGKLTFTKSSEVTFCEASFALSSRVSFNVYSSSCS